MNVFILTDLEGSTGAFDIECIDRTSQAYRLAANALEDDLILAAYTCRKHGADRVFYLDGHGGGGNIDPNRLSGIAEDCGGINGWMELLQNGKIDCQIEIGAHARAGTINGFLDHTLSSKQYFSLSVNGFEQSETSLHAMICSAYKVPIVALTGDFSACKQAQEYIAGLPVGIVKTASERNHCIPVTNPQSALAQAVTDGITHYQDFPLYLPEAPYTFELTYYRSDYCEEQLQRARHNPERIDARTLRWHINKLTTYWDTRP